MEKKNLQTVNVRANVKVEVELKKQYLHEMWYGSLSIISFDDVQFWLHFGWCKFPLASNDEFHDAGSNSISEWGVCWLTLNNKLQNWFN